jgi:hypothetical protein
VTTDNTFEQLLALVEKAPTLAALEAIRMRLARLPVGDRSNAVTDAIARRDAEIRAKHPAGRAIGAGIYSTENVQFEGNDIRSTGDGLVVFDTKSSSFKRNRIEAGSATNVDEMLAQLEDAANRAPVDRRIRRQLTRSAKALRKAHGTPSFRERYDDFVGSLADHAGLMQFFGSFIQALSKLIDG